MNDRDEKLRLVREVIDFVVEQPYDPEVLAKFVYLKSLDARVYRYGDKRLNEIFDVLRGDERRRRVFLFERGSFGDAQFVHFG